MSSTELPVDWADDVLHFWFHELQEQDWFRSGSRVDEKCRARFGGIHAALKADPPDPESADARTLLAAVIVLDQIPRNIFRKTPAAYATDAEALALARHAVASGKDRALRPFSPSQRHPRASFHTRGIGVLERRAAAGLIVKGRARRASGRAAGQELTKTVALKPAGWR